MVQYKVNLRFKENGKSLNEILTNALKIELEKHSDMTDYILSQEMPLQPMYSFQSERNIKNEWES